MAVLQIQPALVVACSMEEFKWASLFFQKTEPVFHVDVGDFHNEVTALTMQDEPAWAQGLVKDVFSMLRLTQQPESIIFC